MSSSTDAASPAAPSNGNVQDVIREAQDELKQLLRQRVALLRRLGTVKQTLVYLANAFGDEALTPEVLRILGRDSKPKQPGFTRTCRVILMEAARPLEAWQGLWELQRRFPHLIEHHKHPLAAVTTVFNRLVASGEVRSFPNGRGRRVWEWIAEPSGEEASLSSSVDEQAQAMARQ